MKIVKYKKYPDYVIEKYLRNTELYKNPWKPEKDQWIYKLRWPDGSLSEDFYNKSRAADLIQRRSIQKLEMNESVVVR